MKDKIQFEESSGNVFKDLGLDNSEERLTKVKIASKVYDIIKERNLSVKDTGKILKINRSKVSDLRNGKLYGFSMDDLFSFLCAFDQDIEIIIQPKKQSKAHLNLSFVPA